MSHDVSGWCSLSSAHTRRNLLWDGLYYSQNVRALKYLYRVLISLPLQNCHMWQHFIPVSSRHREYFRRHREYIFGADGDYSGWAGGAVCEDNAKATDRLQVTRCGLWPPGPGPDIRLGKQCDQREIEKQVQTYTSNFSPPVLRKLAEIERLKCFFLIYF